METTEQTHKALRVWAYNASVPDLCSALSDARRMQDRERTAILDAEVAYRLDGKRSAS